MDELEATEEVLQLVLEEEEPVWAPATLDELGAEGLELEAETGLEELADAGAIEDADAEVEDEDEAAGDEDVGPDTGLLLVEALVDLALAEDATLESTWLDEGEVYGVGGTEAEDVNVMVEVPLRVMVSVIVD